MVDVRVSLPEPHPEDDEDVVWGLSTATALWARGEQRDAIVWLRRAADAARAAGQEFRASELGISATALEEVLEAGPDGAASQDGETLESTDAAAAPGERIDRTTMEIEPELVSVPPPPPVPPPAPPIVAPSTPVPAAVVAPTTPVTPTAAPASIPAVSQPIASSPASSSKAPSQDAARVAPVSSANPQSQTPRSKKMRQPILDPWADEPTPLPTPPPSSLRVVANNDELLVSRRTRPTARAGEDEDGVYTSAVPLELALGKRSAPKPPPPPPPPPPPAGHSGRTKTIDQRNKGADRPGQIAPAAVAPKPPPPPSSGAPVSPAPPPTTAALASSSSTSSSTMQAVSATPSANVPAPSPSQPSSAPTSSSPHVSPPSAPVVTEPSPVAPARAPVSPLPPAFPRTSQSDEVTPISSSQIVDEETSPLIEPASAAPPMPPLELDDLEPLGVATTMPAPADAVSAPARVVIEPAPPPPAIAAPVSNAPLELAPLEDVAPKALAPANEPASPPAVVKRASTPAPAPDGVPPTKRLSSRPAGDPGPILAGVALGRVEGLIDLPNDSLVKLAKSARLESLAPDEEVAGYAATLVLEGEAIVCATIIDAPAFRAPTGTLIPAKGSIADCTAIRVVAHGGVTRVAVWDQRSIDEAVSACPWVLDELTSRADRILARAGATMGALGDVDEASRNLLLDRLTIRVTGPLEVITELGKPTPGVLIVVGGTIDVLASNRTARAGEILFPREVVGGRPAPSDARSGPNGALLLVGPKHVAQELFVSAPSLVDFLGGEGP